MAIQTFGDLVNFHPHLHAIVSDGLFAPSGWFYVSPKIDLKKLEVLFRHRVLRMLLREGKIDEALIKKLLGWRHSGFSIHHQVRIGSQDQIGRETLAQYVLRSPFSQQKMRYHPKSQTVLYRSKMNPVIKRNFEVFPALDWITALTAHIPNPGEHLVQYYGYYSNASRGKLQKAQDQSQQPAPEGTIEIPPNSVSPALKQHWAQFINKVYEGRSAALSSVLRIDADSSFY